MEDRIVICAAHDELRATVQQMAAELENVEGVIFALSQDADARVVWPNLGLVSFALRNIVTRLEAAAH